MLRHSFLHLVHKTYYPTIFPLSKASMINIFLKISIHILHSLNIISKPFQKFPHSIKAFVMPIFTIIILNIIFASIYPFPTSRAVVVSFRWRIVWASWIMPICFPAQVTHITNYLQDNFLTYQYIHQNILTNLHL